MLDGVGDFGLKGVRIEWKDDRTAAVNVVGLGGEASAEVGQGSPGNFEEEIAVDARGKRGQAGLAKEFVDRRDLAQEVGFGGAGHRDISAQMREIGENLSDRRVRAGRYI